MNYLRPLVGLAVVADFYVVDVGKHGTLCLFMCISE